MRYLLVAALAVMLALPVAAQDFEKGLEAYDRGDYATALREWRPLAEQGFANAQYDLGLMYKEGQGVPRDDGEAVAWYRRAAEQGYAEAQNNLGDLYASGRGVSLDYARAVGWFRKAAEQGDAEAQNNLGVMYGHGLGVRRDYAQAHMWWSIAVNGGYRAAALRRDQVAARMTAADVSKSRRLAREWLAKYGK